MVGPRCTHKGEDTRRVQAGKSDGKISLGNISYWEKHCGRKWTGLTGLRTGTRGGMW